MAEKARALLALAADNKAEYGICLTAEEMAVLVDDGYDNNKLAGYRYHLSRCEKCYGEWVSLKKMQSSGRPGARIFRLSRLKKYSYIGSALAAAASIAVFLNIYIPPQGVDEKSVEEPVIGQQMSESLSVQTPQEKEEMDKEGSVEQGVSPAPVATEAVRELMGEDKASPATVGRQLFRGKNKKQSVPAARLNRRVVETGAVEEVASDQADAGFRSGGRTFADIDSWLRTVKESCETGRSEPDFWSSIYLEGEKVLKSQSGTPADEMEEKVIAILRLLAQVKSGSVKEQCREILVLLETDGPITITR